MYFHFLTLKNRRKTVFVVRIQCSFWYFFVSQNILSNSLSRRSFEMLQFFLKIWNAAEWNFQTEHTDTAFHHFYNSDSSVHFPLKTFKIKNACHKNKQIKQIIVWKSITISFDKKYFLYCVYDSLMFNKISHKEPIIFVYIYERFKGHL